MIVGTLIVLAVLTFLVLIVLLWNIGGSCPLCGAYTDLTGCTNCGWEGKNADD